MDVTRFFHPVLRAAELRGSKPVRVVLDGTPLALFRDHRGGPAALLDQCPHRFAPLSAGRVTDDGRLACRYHGWRFDSTGIGESPSRARPRPCTVRAFQAIERHEFIWVASADTPARAMPDIAPAGYALAGTISAQISAPLHVVLDNFSENEHTPFVHTMFGWSESSLNTIAFDAENFDGRTEVRY
ncbi:MAG: Rieske 2Fe-2S domain-containing protein [Polyangiaceae bacterium]